MRAPLLALTLALMPLAPAWAGPQIEPAPTLAPAGDYHLDPAHARLMFRVNHLGFSNYTAFFRDFDAQLTFDPADPQAMALQASVDPASVETLFPDPGFDFNAVIAGPQFLDAAQFPEMRFDSTKITLTAPDRAALSGLLTLHGVTRPVTLRVTFNGGYGGHPMDPGGARVGFSATGTLFRSDFGIGFGIPEPGSSLGVSDAVEIVIEAEFINPAASGVQVGP
jgi:polyisoprenoid-binding protein YceI